jgi:hypothetical protein
MRIALGMIFCCLFVLGCRTNPPKATLIHEKNSTATRTEILKLIPIGTPLNQAEGILVKNGFGKVEDPSKWPKPQPGTAPIPSGKVDEDAPYVTYVIEAPVDHLVTRAWYVQLYHKASVVENIKVTAGGLTGP